MDLNSNANRLQVLNSANPSLRVSVAPTPQPTLMVGGVNPNTTIELPTGPTQTPTITLPGGGSVSNDSGVAGAQDTGYTPPSQDPGFWGHLLNAGKDIIKPFVYTGEDVSNAIGNAEVGLAHAMGINRGQTETNQQQFGDINSGMGIQTQDNNLKNFGGNLLQVGAVAAAPFTGGSSLGAEAAIDAGLGAAAGIGNTMTQNNQSVGDYLRNAAIGGALGGAGRFLFNGAGKLISPILNKFGAGASDALSNAVAQEGDAGVIQAGLGVSPEASQFLAQQSDPGIIKNVLDELGVDTGSNTVRSLADAQLTAAKSSPQNQIQFMDPMHPTQEQLPAGWHPDGAADPVPVLENAARTAPTAEDFVKYINGLTGEEKAAATSALDGMTPEEFYSKAGGGSEVKPATPTTNPTASLPPEDQAAIRAAGGQIPDTTMHLPSKGIYARLTPEQARLLADEVNNVKSDGNDIVHLSALTPQLQKNAKEVALEDLTKESPNAAATISKMQNTLPPEDMAAIKLAGGELPNANEIAAKTDAADNTAANPNSDAATQQAIDEVLKKLPTASRQYNEAAAIRSGEKASRVAQGAAAFEGAGGGQEGLYAKLGAHSGEYTKSGFGMDISPESRDSLINSIESNPNLQPYEKLNAQMAVMKLTHDTPNGPTPYEIGLLRKAFGDNFGDQVQQAVDESTTTGQKIATAAGQVAGLPKSIMASMDISGTLRQGGMLASRFPKEAAQAFGDQLKYFASEDAYKQGMAEIAARPSYQSMLDSKLAVTGTEALDKSEEQYVSNLAEKIPGLGRGVAASDRAYTGFLTKLRADVFDTITQANGGAENLSQKELDDISKVINTMTGRGDLGKFLEQHSQTLSTALFSPRLWKSRLDFLNPVYYAKLSPVARKYALQTAASYAGAVTTVLSLASLIPGVTVSTNPTSADFGKIKYKNERYDIMGGLGQNIVAIAREVTGEETNSQTGQTTQLGSKFGGATRLSVLSNLIQNKENPLLSAASQLLQGKDRGGNPVNPVTTLANLFVPLTVSGVAQTANDFGNLKSPSAWVKGFALNAPDLIGISAQNYGSIPSKFQGPNAPNSQMPTYNGPIQPNMVTDYNGKAVLDKNGKPVTVTPPANATPDEIKQMVDAKRAEAVKSQYERSLPEETQILMKMSDSQLQDYVKSGEISQQQYDQIKNIQKTADSVSQGNQYKIPAGAKSTLSQNYFSHWNSMDAKDQQAWLKQAPDQNSIAIANTLNQQLVPGAPAFQPSNALAKAYAEFENDLNTHNGSDPTKETYDAIKIQQKTRAFQEFAYKTQVSQVQKDLYDAGGSADIKALLSQGKISQDDLNAAINLDNTLYNTGLESSLKFSKTFRKAYGYETPATRGSSTGGSGGGTRGSGYTKGPVDQYGGYMMTNPNNGVQYYHYGPGHMNQDLTGLIGQTGMFPKNITRPGLQGVPGTTAAPTGQVVPRFSKATRQNPDTPLKFAAPNVTPGKGKTRVTIAPYRTVYARSLSNVSQ